MPRMLRTRSLFRTLPVAAIAAAMLAGLTHGAPQYWDTNGSGGGSGNAGGSWADANWSSDSSGGSATTTWTAGSDAVFSAGTDGTGTWTVDVGATRSVLHLTAEEGNVTLGTSGDFSLAGPATWGANSGATLTVARNVDNGGNLFTVDTAGDTAISGVIGGSGELTKNGSGRLDLSAANSHTGNTTLNAGALRASGNNTATLGTGASQLYLNGGTLESYTDSTGTIDYGRDVTVGADTALKYGRLTSSGTNNAGTRQFGALSIGADLTASLDPTNFTIGRVNSASLKFDSTTLTGDAKIDVYSLAKSSTYRYLTLGSITDSGSSDLTVRNAWFYGRNYVTGQPTIGGDLLLDGGSLLQDNTGDTTLSTVGGNIELRNGGVLGLTDDFTRPLGDGPGQIQLTGSSYNGFTANGTRHVTVTLTDPATGLPAQLKWNTGYFNCTGLSLSVAGASSTSTLHLVNPIDLNGSGGYMLNYYGGVNELSGQITNSSSTPAGIRTNPYGQATLYLSNNGNTFDGPITFQGGEIQFDTVGNIGGGPSGLGNPTTAANGRITLSYYNTSAARHYLAAMIYTGSGVSSTDRTLRLNANGSIFANGTGAIIFTSDLDVSVYDTDRTLTLRGTGAGDNAFDGDIADHGATYPTSIIKTDAGKWSLGGANTYTGTTQVNAGTLLVNGTHGGAGDYTVQSGATLGGSGTITPASGSDVTISGGLAPGASVGTLTINGDLTLNAGSVYSWELGSSGSDTTEVTGLLSLDDWTLKLLDDGGAAMPGDKLHVFTGFSGLDLTGGSSPADFNVSFDTSQVALWMTWTNPADLELGQDGAGLYLTGLSTAPEPSTLLLLLLGAAGLLARGRRRRR